MTNAELAILSLIAEEPRHGYQIEQVIEARGMRDWTEIGFSSIYYLLKKLEKEGLVEGRLEKAEGRGPARKVYHLTPAGGEAWVQASLGALSTPKLTASHFLTGLANLPGLPEDAAIKALKDYHSKLEERYQHLKAQVEAQSPLPDFVEALFDYSYAMLNAERDWIKGYIKQLEVKMSTKVDFKKELKHLYNPSKKEFTIIEVPPMNYLMVDGKGYPQDNPSYEQAMEALYGMAYTIKFALKPQGIEFVVPPLEGLWWTEGEGFDAENKDEWLWTAMIMQPEQVTPEVVEQARAELKAKKDPPALSKLRFETYEEGLCMQIMYLGPYSDEGPTIARMHEFAKQQGYKLRGKHHEIYMSDPRRTAPEKLKTVIRQPIEKV